MLICLQAGKGKPSESTDYILNKAPVIGDQAEILHPLEDVTVISPEKIVLECDIDVGTPPADIEWYVLEMNIVQFRFLLFVYIC